MSFAFSIQEPVVQNPFSGDNSNGFRRQVSPPYEDFVYGHGFSGKKALSRQTTEVKESKEDHLEQSAESTSFGYGSCESPKQKTQESGFTPSVQLVIYSQLVFYLSPGVLIPMLFSQVQKVFTKDDAATTYSLVLTTSRLVGMVAPILFGCWAEFRGAREVYVCVNLVAALACITLMFKPALPIFVIAWALLNVPSALRNVRSTFLVKSLPAEQVCNASHLAAANGMLGGFLGTALAVVLPVLKTFGFESFITGSSLGVFSYICVAFFSSVMLVPPEIQTTTHQTSNNSFEPCMQCECCKRDLAESSEEFDSSLCPVCYANFGGTGMKFSTFSMVLLVAFSFVGGLLDLSISVLFALFQPLAVDEFSWSLSSIAAVYMGTSGISAILSVVLFGSQVPDRLQFCAAAICGTIAVVVAAYPPLSERRLVLGVLFGTVAQIIYQAPYLAIFADLIGKARVTYTLTTVLCLAPLIGQAIGTALSSFALSYVNTPYFLLIAVPACIASTAATACTYMIDIKGSDPCRCHAEDCAT